MPAETRTSYLINNSKRRHILDISMIGKKLLFCGKSVDTALLKENSTAPLCQQCTRAYAVAIDITSDGDLPNAH